MTLILNILHRDLSVLAADRRAIAVCSADAMSSRTSLAEGDSVVHNFKKITLNSRASLAVGIAGYTHQHGYMRSIESSIGIDEGLSKISKHVDGFMNIHDRSSLLTLTEFRTNQGIASFLDSDTGMYFTNTYLFSQIEKQSRLHRGADIPKVLCAGSGSEYFKSQAGIAAIADFIASTKNSCTLQACISWMQDAFKRVASSDADIGATADFVVSTRSDLLFRFVDPSNAAAD